MRHSRSEFLLWTTVEVAVISENLETNANIARVFEFFVDFEREFSRFRSDSSLCLLNAAGSAQVSPRFIELLALCKEAYFASEGRFNPLADVSAIGYSKTFESGEFVPTSLRSANVDFSAVTVEGDVVTLGKGQSLDFGGIGKGYAVGLASSLLRSFGYSDFFVNAGGDIFASGTNAKEPGWRIGIENPFTGDVLASVLARNVSVTTSGSYKRKWEVEGRPYHHIVDPKTGENPNDIVSVTLVGAECARCDAFTKAIFNLSVEDGLSFVRKNGMDGLVVTREGEIFHTVGMLKKHALAFA